MEACAPEPIQHGARSGSQRARRCPRALGDMERGMQGIWGGTVVPKGLVPCREKWCHMTQEERDDSLRFNENITFGQLG